MPAIPTRRALRWRLLLLRYVSVSRNSHGGIAAAG
jgi:hypothetical protein